MAINREKTPPSSKPIPSEANTVVVGAGVAGLYASWRLLNETTDNADLVVLEKNNAFGGRLKSDIVMQKPGNFLHEEEGGMRFVLNNMDNLMALFMAFELYKDIIPFVMDCPQSNRYYLRSKSFTQESTTKNNQAIWSELYHLNEIEKNLSPTDIIQNVFARILKENPSFQFDTQNQGSAELWQQFRLQCTWHGKALYQISLWDMIADMGYSHECITLLYQTLGFNCALLSKAHAGSALQLLFEFPADAQFYTLKKGFSTLAKTLSQAVGYDRIFLQTELEKITLDQNDGCYHLHYSQLDQDGQITTSTIKAKHVILALPRLALEKLYIRSNFYNLKPQGDALWCALQSTTQIPLAKLNLYYDKAWWTDTNDMQSLDVGHHFTDTPLGSVYPFYSLYEKDVAAIEYAQRVEQPTPEVQQQLSDIYRSIYNKNAALTVYCDYLNINYWHSLQQNGPFSTSTLQELCNQQTPQTLFPASLDSITSITATLKALFKCKDIPKPILTSARIWEGGSSLSCHTSQSYGFGFHLWAIGTNDKAVIESLIEIGPNLFTCGESFSDYQGWVEGALRSTNLVLKKGFNLAPYDTIFQQKQGLSAGECIQKIYEEKVARRIRKYIDKNY